MKIDDNPFPGDQNMVDAKLLKGTDYEEEEGDEEEYVWQEGQWCPRGLTRSQKRMVQRLRNRKLEQAQKSGKPQVWCVKQTTDKG